MEVVNLSLSFELGVSALNSYGFVHPFLQDHHLGFLELRAEGVDVGDWQLWHLHEVMIKETIQEVYCLAVLVDLFLMAEG